MKNSNDKNLNRLWLVGASVSYPNLGVGKVVKVSVQEPDGDWKVTVKVKNASYEESANKLDNWCMIYHKKKEQCLFNKYVSR